MSTGKYTQETALETECHRGLWTGDSVTSLCNVNIKNRFLGDLFVVRPGTERCNEPAEFS